MSATNKREEERENWVPPKSVEDLYPALGGNQFDGLNADVARSRNNNLLPKGPAEYQLYSLATPNGQKASIACEEFGIDYNAHTIMIMRGEQFSKGFMDVNPNARIPCMLHGKTRIFESVAILLYLAETQKKFFPQDPAKRAEAYSWLMWQTSGQGPMFGQFGHFFRYAPRKKHEVIEYGVARYGMEVRRLLSVMENHLSDGRTWWMGDEYTIVDMALYPWTMVFGGKGYNANAFLGRDSRYPFLNKWCERMAARPAVQRGMLVCGGPGSMDELRKLNAKQSIVNQQAGAKL